MIGWTQELLAFVDEHESDDVRQLALQAERFSGIDIPFAIRQIKGRQIIKEKSLFWYQYKELLLPQHLSLEQASSELTARYKASLCLGDSFVDLTGGLGIDFYFMSEAFKTAVYVEQKEELCKIASHNFSILPHSAEIQVKNDDSVSFLESMPVIDVLYIDPARRDAVGKKTILISDCTPNLEEIDELLNKNSRQTIIKLSPMLDINLALKTLTNIVAVHVLSVKNECKELVFLKDNRRFPSERPITFHCVELAKGKESIFSFSPKSNFEIKYSSQILRYLYEPNSSIMKAGGYNYLQEKFELKKLHPNSHLYTSDLLITEFPGRIFEVEKTISPNKKEIKKSISSLKQANLTVRNYPFSVNELRKNLKLKEGGDIYIFATTLADNQKILILTKKAEFS